MLRKGIFSWSEDFCCMGQWFINVVCNGLIGYYRREHDLRLRLFMAEMTIHICQ